MTERHIENSYKDVTGLIRQFMQYHPHEGLPLLLDLNDVHDIPDIGQKLFEEEKNDLIKMIAVIKTNYSLTAEEQTLLLDAQNMLNDIETQIAYNAGNDRVKANHTIKYNFEHLSNITDDEIYQKSLSFAEKKVYELYKNKLGARPGTVVFHSALDVMLSFYYYSLLLDDLNAKERSTIIELLYDIARNINKHACTYLEQKDEVFLVNKLSKSA